MTLTGSVTPTLDPESLIGLYRQMVLIRAFDQRVLQLRLEDRIYGTVHPYVGQEGIAVGVASTLRHGDQVVSHHRGHGHCLAMGAAPSRTMAELFGRKDGYCGGRGGSMHVVDISHGVLGANGIVGAGLPIATGAALAAEWRGKGQVVVAFFGDGATGQGIFHESLNLAALWRLPVIFVCENNEYAVETPLSQALAKPDIAGFGAQYGMPGVVVDGTDVLAVRDASLASVERARSGQGPSLLECRTHRWLVHAQRGVAIPERRPEAVLERARSEDPIRRLRDWLVDEGLATSEQLAWVDLQVSEELEAAVGFAEGSPYPEPGSLLEAVGGD
jgi:TPP-dependent pyruvate/acetoin dehydrogenase alpha subunit